MTDDARIVKALLAGDSAAFACLVERCQGMVWHLIQRMVDLPDEVPDLAQDVFLQVHRRLGQFRFEASLGTWIGQIAFSCACRHLRRRRIPLVEWPAVDADADVDRGRSDALAVAEPDRESQFDDEPALLRTLAHALQRLPLCITWKTCASKSLRRVGDALGDDLVQPREAGCAGIVDGLVDTLRQSKPQHGRRRITATGAHFVPEALRIVHRPEEIDARLLPGHWEGGFVKGAYNRSGVDRFLRPPPHGLLGLRQAQAATLGTANKPCIQTG